MLAKKNQLYTFVVPLVQQLKAGEARIVLQWSGGIPKLELFAAAQEGPGQCIASFNNAECPGLVYEKNYVHRTKSIKVSSSGQKPLLFYVKEYIDYKKFTVYSQLMQESIAQLNDMFLNSEARITYYVAEHNFPAQELAIPL